MPLPPRPGPSLRRVFPAPGFPGRMRDQGLTRMMGISSWSSPYFRYCHQLRCISRVGGHQWRPQHDPAGVLERRCQVAKQFGFDDEAFLGMSLAQCVLSAQPAVHTRSKGTISFHLISPVGAASVFRLQSPRQRAAGVRMAMCCDRSPMAVHRAAATSADALRLRPGRSQRGAPPARWTAESMPVSTSAGCVSSGQRPRRRAHCRVRGRRVPAGARRVVCDAAAGAARCAQTATVSSVAIYMVKTRERQCALASSGYSVMQVPSRSTSQPQKRRVNSGAPVRR